MKRFHTFILAAIAILLSLNESVSYAQLASKGNWNTTTIKKNLEVTLTGDITIKGCITINSGYTLTILNNSDTPYTLSVDPAFANGTNIFANSGNLIIKGNQSGRITIDGGAAFTYTSDNGMPVSLSAGTSKKIKAGIQNSGNITLEYVTIQNINDSDSYGGAITSSISASKAINLRHCIITKCYSQLGSAIMITGGAGPVTIEDSEISKCFSGAGGTERAGGAIRTYGSVTSSLYLTRVSFRNNYSQRTLNYDNTWDRDGSGGAIFWNARGLNTTECVMNGCLFEYNKCDDNGGAIKTQGSIRFTGAETIIQNNMAPNGAGIYIEGYIGGSGVGSAREITYDLNNYLKVINNTSPSYVVATGGKTYNYSGKGAGIHFYFGSTMTLEAQSTINVNMNGAIISNNESCGTESLGGGIYFENTSPSSKGYKFNINLNYGTVSGNKANKGGGIFVSKGDVLSKKFEGNSLTASGNTAEHGAGIYVMDGKLSLADGNITENSSTGNGGGVYVNGGDFTMNDGYIKSNNALDGGGVYLYNGNFSLVYGELNGNTASQNGGGVYIIGGGNFEMSDGEIADNSSTSLGGGVYIEGGDFTMNDGSIRSNNALEGGGVYLYNGNFSLVHGELNGNTASQNGGGVYLVGEECEYQLKNGSISNNTSNNGGGVYLADGSFILGESISDTGTIFENNVSGEGGGVYIDGAGDFTMNGGTVEKNSSTGSLGGGGIFLNGGDFTLNNGNISDNYSEAQGGGIYLNGGSLTVSQGRLSNNTSMINGGGIYILNGEVEMGSGEIRSNSCQEYGGGVYVYNSTDTKTTVDFSGGVLINNSASYGGGICVNGYIDLTIERVQIVENTATNGGGVCLMNNATMYFGIGEIRENIAVKKSSETYATGYGGDPAYVKIDEIQGFGGGIYLDSYTSLQFKNVNQLGLFKNLADSGGDEIFASGLETYVDLPDVGEMGVKGYPGASNLKWIEDYPNNDPYYYKGTKLKGNVWDTDRTNLRYRETISQNAIIFNLSGDLAQSGKYICFALGYEVSHITIIRKGLQNGESAIFHLRKNDANDFKIIMTGDGSDQTIKRIAVSAGTWTVTEMPWSWAYSQENRVITRDVPDPDPVQNSETGKMEDRPFVFTLTRTEDNHLPLNDEDAVINVMGD